MNRNRRDALIAYLVILFVMAGTFAVKAAELHHGDWTLAKRADDPDKVEFGLIEHRGHGMSSHSSDWPLSAFQGLDISKPGKREVHFTITRDAGKFDCEGYLNDGEGAGLFRFAPDANYPREMATLGFGGVDDEKQYSMAVMDVTLAFAKGMKAEHVSGLDTDKLVAFRIFNVNAGFIDELRAAGLTATDADKLVAFRIHGVTPEMVKYLHDAGYTPSEDTLVAMRIHGATPEWIAQLKKEGYDHVDLDKLIAFRIHGVSPDFIGKVQALGFRHPEPDQLVAMRIHGVTPEFISRLKARGMQNLTIDDLVGLKIHGID